MSDRDDVYAWLKQACGKRTTGPISRSICQLDDSDLANLANLADSGELHKLSPIHNPAATVPDEAVLFFAETGRTAIEGGATVFCFGEW